MYIYHGNRKENTLCTVHNNGSSKENTLLTYIEAAVRRTHCVHISWQQFGKQAVYIYTNYD